MNRENGAEVTRIPGCPVLHGVTEDPRTGRLFWGCQTHVLVLGTRADEFARVVARIPYPTRQRIAAFHQGGDGVLWGSTGGGVEALYRLHTSKEPYTLTAVPLRDRALRVRTTEDGSHLLGLTFSGTLQVRNASTGELLREIAVSRPFDPNLHEHTDKASLPDLVARGTVAWISLPHEGRVVEVDIAAGAVQRVIETGGEPTRLVLVAASAPEGR